MQPPKRTDDRPKSRIWVWVVVAFVIQVCVWTGLFVLAAHHPVDEVPTNGNGAVVQNGAARRP